MNTDSQMNDVLTAKVASNALRQVTIGSASSRLKIHSSPWKELKASITRDFNMFVVLVSASAGDTGPFLRLLDDLVVCLPVKYHTLRLHPSADYWDASVSSMPHLDKSAATTIDGEQWLKAMHEIHPDAVITNQLFFRARDRPRAGDQDWEKIVCDELTELPRRLGISVLVVEFLQQELTSRVGTAEWTKATKDGQKTLDDYKRWQTGPPIDEAKLAAKRAEYGARHLPGILMLECYPAELMTKGELSRAVGIVCGQVEAHVGRSSLPQSLVSFLQKQRTDGRHIVLLARGGRHANSATDRSVEHDLLAVVDHKLAGYLAKGVAVVAQGAVGTAAREVTRHVFSVPRMGTDFSLLLPWVDLIIHHGGSCATFTALKAGVPQMIIPGLNDWADQLHHGCRVESMGCGRVVGPQRRLDSNVNDGAIADIVSAVQDMLHELSLFHAACRQWKEKLEEASVTEEGILVAVDTLQRILVAIMLERAEG